ncbi:MAG: hypothetical protein JNL06_13000 [Alphaproteobacteria bacterium]|nr:hypothetical protein [Alphaproteobacteria bacterium]
MRVAEGIQANKAAKAEAVASEQQARLVRQTAAMNAQRPLDEGRERIGQYLAQTGQSNVDLSRGSPVEAAAKIAERAQRDHLTALHGGEVAAWGHKVDAVAARARGRSALQGAILGAGMSLLGEASKENWFGGNPRRSSHAGSRTFIVPYHGL